MSARFALLVGILVCSTEGQRLNDRPIIGILDQESYGDRAHLGQTYIAASYVKWVEGSGGRVVPIHVLQNETYYQEIFHRINGVLFPGGGQYLPNSSYYSAAKTLYRMAITANDAGDYFPLWGHCLGFELLTVLANNDTNWLQPNDAEDWPQPIVPTKKIFHSRLFASVSSEVWNPLVTQSVTVNFHQYGLSPQNFSASGLHRLYKVLATNYDRNGREFVSIIEGVRYPFFGLQFHPEKNNYEINGSQATPHSSAAILVSQYFANVFVNQARINRHRFPDATSETASLIYNYEPVYRSPSGSTFTQIYAFNVTD